MNKHSKIVTIKLLFICSVSFLNPVYIFAQSAPLFRMEIPSSPNPVGSGARALGMGAFIAIADDATAASWNPGGLIQLIHPEMSSVFSFTHRKEGNHFINNPESQGVETIDTFNLNYLSVVSPILDFNGNKMIFSLNYQHLYDFSREWSLAFNDLDPIFNGPVRYNYEQNGGLYALGLAYCLRVNPKLSTGFTINFWDDYLSKNRWTQKYYERGKILYQGNTADYSVNKEEIFNFQGININLGFRLEINDYLTIGGVLKTPFNADIDHRIQTDTTIRSESKEEVKTSEVSSYKESLKMPLSYGLGFSLSFLEPFLFSRISDKFKISGDVYRTHWNNFIYCNTKGEEKSPISGKDAITSDIDPVTWFRLGAEYVIVGEKIKVPLRAGIFYDPAPAEVSPDDYYGFSLGFGLTYESFVFDLAYQFRFGNDVSESILQNMNFYQDVREHTIYSSIIYYLE